MTTGTAAHKALEPESNIDTPGNSSPRSSNDNGISSNLNKERYGCVPFCRNPLPLFTAVATMDHGFRAAQSCVEHLEATITDALCITKEDKQIFEKHENTGNVALYFDGSFRTTQTRLTGHPLVDVEGRTTKYESSVHWCVLYWRMRTIALLTDASTNHLSVYLCS